MMLCFKRLHKQCIVPLTLIVIDLILIIIYRQKSHSEDKQRKQYSSDEGHETTPVPADISLSSPEVNRFGHSQSESLDILTSKKVNNILLANYSQLYYGYCCVLQIYMHEEYFVALIIINNNNAQYPVC